MFIVHPNPNGSLAITFPVGGDIQDIIPNGPHFILDTLAVDIDFLDAYDFDSMSVFILVPDRAKEIQKNRWREARKPLLASLDIAFTKALEKGDTTLQQSIAAQKQALRDVTLTELPDDLDGIKATWPSILNP